MDDSLIRTEMLFGKEAMEKLASSTVAVFGVGGVGCSVVEALARAGIGKLVITDSDVFSRTNINRQLYALQSTVGRYKVDVAEERVKDINPYCTVEKHRAFYLPANRGDYGFAEYDYVVDAVDTVTAKIDIILAAKENGVPVISAMGTGNKLDPTAFEVADIYSTSVCPLAKVMRGELRARGVESLKVVYSREEAVKPLFTPEDELPQGRRALPASNSFVPTTAGFIIAGVVIKDIVSGVK
ncbi:MAG: tRNA threonylcarbamoyladenosine dehydratase [Clostridia bacterium]|nr:tRNA threonylcarbamoyladenosine dehydratase [Clostridia bacterium]